MRGQMTGASYLQLRNVVKSYDGRVNAVDDISIDIEQGEFVTFLGPSGSGKTTTLMMVAGFEEVTSGSIDIEGHDLTRKRPHERNIGMVFQNYALFPHMTAAQNVAFPLKMRHFPKSEIQTRVQKVLELVGLKKFTQKRPREMSGGQQQRVALARGMVFNPDVLLLDEPLGALDKNLREQMQVEIKRIQKEVGITTIYVTHDQTEAMTMSDRVAVFGEGKLRQIAPPLEIYNRPTSKFVGEFIGDSNFFQGKVGSAGVLEIEGLCVSRIGNTSLSSGTTVDLLVRPERIRIAKPGENLTTVRMTVETLVNYGDNVLAIGKAGNQPLRMRIAGGPPAELQEGATLTVGWVPEEAHPIPRG
jgi:putative spermidine/putrescine transport system ATP-binding protein